MSTVVKAEISQIYSYLIQPGKGTEEAPEIAGAVLDLSGQVFKMMKTIYDNAETECKIPICFVMDENGKQKNVVRDEIIAFIKTPSKETGEVIARRLQSVTTAKSGMGLLFFTIGTNHKGEPKLVISRFPADQGLLADTQSSGLLVQFVEKVFMKNAHAYKAVVYQGDITENFWEGIAVDRQINSAGGLANYWIRDFLMSDFKMTAKEGTKQLALALKEASMKMEDSKQKEEIVAAMRLVKNFNNKALSISQLISNFGLSKAVRDNIISYLPHAELAELTFTFDAAEFSKHAGFIWKELDNGAIVTAPSESFGECFKEKKIPNSDGLVEISTQGRVVNQRLKTRKV